MKTTPNLQIPYPDRTEHTRLWELFEALAKRVDEVAAGIGGKLYVAQQRSEPGSYRGGYQHISFTTTQWPAIDMLAETDLLEVSIAATLSARHDPGAYGGAMFAIISNGQPLRVENAGLMVERTIISAGHVSTWKVTKGATLKIVPQYWFSGSPTRAASFVRHGLLAAEAVS